MLRAKSWEQTQSQSNNATFKKTFKTAIIDFWPLGGSKNQL